MTDYNEIYLASENALGAPYAPLMQSIKAHVPANSSVLDVGCGQGRDALPLARLGHKVTAIDAAPAGIASLAKAAAQDGLAIEAEVADLRNWSPTDRYDVLLCNRILHMLPRADRIALFKKLLDHVAENGFVYLVDEPSNMTDLKSAITAKSRPAEILRDAKGDYFIRLDQQDSMQ